MRTIHYPHFTLSEKLTAEQKEFFHEHGFIHFKNFIQPQTVGSFIQASQQVQQKWIDRKLEKANGVPIKYGTDLDGSRIVQRFAFINHHNPTFTEVLRDPRFEALLELVPGSRIGENEKDGMVFNHYINSENSQFTQMGWHTDGLRDIFYGKKVQPMLNVGIHLDNLLPENGGLRVIPGTHNQGVFDLLFRKRYFLDTRPDPDEVAIIPNAGDLTVHDGRLWHRVAKSSVIGEASRRRVIYVPLITGKYEPKDETSPTAFYQRFAGIVK